MYHLINHHIQVILQSIPQDEITKYDRLIADLNQVSTPGYQTSYRSYWKMDGAGLDAAYRGAYFQELQSALANRPDLASLVAKLFETPTDKLGTKKLEFSFATKLLHTADRQRPIYDTHVTAFYFFQPLTKRPAKRSDEEWLQDRTSDLIVFYNFLSDEYTRVLANGLLAKSIRAFRSKFNPKHFTDVRIIDLLIWTYVEVLNKRGLIDGRIVFR